MSRRVNVMLSAAQNRQDRWKQKQREKESLRKQLNIKLKPTNEWFISYKHSRKKNWDAFILVLAIYNSFYVPVAASFEFEQSKFLFFCDIFIEIMFLIDVVLMMFTSYQNRRGEEITDLSLIRREYMLTFLFFVDIMSVMAMLKHVYE